MLLLKDFLVLAYDTDTGSCLQCVGALFERRSMSFDLNYFIMYSTVPVPYRTGLLFFTGTEKNKRINVFSSGCENLPANKVPPPCVYAPPENQLFHSYNFPSPYNSVSFF
jgi:Ni,Fe-hydrogenase III small subunit